MPKLRPTFARAHRFAVAAPAAVAFITIMAFIAFIELHLLNGEQYAPIQCCGVSGVNLLRQP